MKTAVHFADNSLINPVNPVTVNLIGAGGTGSNLLAALSKINYALITLGHPGLFVQVFDDDRVNPANLGRQLFAEAELGQYKAVALVNRVNGFFGSNWKAVPKKFNTANIENLPEKGSANIFITCVDTAQARFEIARLLEPMKTRDRFHRNCALYWMDFGNSRYTGQVVLSTVGAITQPESDKFMPIAEMLFVTEVYGHLLNEKNDDDNLPSCSLAEALAQQDLFINDSLARMGGSLLWTLFREGMLFNKGFFLNLKEYKTQPIKVA